jgi:hypothetical protein
VKTHAECPICFDAFSFRDAFLEEGMSQLRNKSFIHPNARGHAVMGRELFRVLSERGVAPSTRSSKRLPADQQVVEGKRAP